MELDSRTFAYPAIDAINMYAATARLPLAAPAQRRDIAGAILGALVAVVFICLFAVIISHRPASDPAIDKGKRNWTGSSFEISIHESALSPSENPVPLLLMPNVDYSQIAATLSTDPAVLCSDFTNSGFHSTSWQHSPIDSMAFECATSSEPRSLDQFTEGGGPSTLFFMFRGSDASRVTALRMKISLLDPDLDGLIIKKVIAFLTKLQEYPDLAVPQSVIKAIAEQKPIVFSGDIATVRFHREIGDPRRFNLTVDYQPAGSRGKKRNAIFVDARRWQDQPGHPIEVPQPQQTNVQSRMAQPAFTAKGRQSDPQLPAPQFPAYLPH